MEDTKTYAALAHELIERPARLGHRLSPVARNTSHGEMTVMETLNRAGRHLTPPELAETSYVSSARIANILRSPEKKETCLT